MKVLEDFINDFFVLEEDRPDDEQGTKKQRDKYDVRRNAMNLRLDATRAAARPDAAPKSL